MKKRKELAMNTHTPILLLAAAFTILLSGCGETPQPAPVPPKKVETQAVQVPTINAQSEALFQEGLKSYEVFDYDKAIAAYNKALVVDQNNYKALSGKGIALAMRGNSTGSTKDVADGIGLIKGALKIAPDYVPTFYDLALAYKIGHHYDESIQWFKKVIDKEPDNTWSYYGIATIYGDKGQAKDAVLYLRKAITLDSKNVKDAARTQSHFDSIRDDPEFKALVE